MATTANPTPTTGKVSKTLKVATVITVALAALLCHSLITAVVATILSSILVFLLSDRVAMWLIPSLITAALIIVFFGPRYGQKGTSVSLGKVSISTKPELKKTQLPAEAIAARDLELRKAEYAQVATVNKFTQAVVVPQRSSGAPVYHLIEVDGALEPEHLYSDGEPLYWKPFEPIFCRFDGAVTIRDSPSVLVLASQRTDSGEETGWYIDLRDVQLPAAEVQVPWQRVWDNPRQPDGSIVIEKKVTVLQLGQATERLVYMPPPVTSQEKEQWNYFLRVRATSGVTMLVTLNQHTLLLKGDEDLHMPSDCTLTGSVVITVRVVYTEGITYGVPIPVEFVYGRTTKS